MHPSFSPQQILLKSPSQIPTSTNSLSSSQKPHTPKPALVSFPPLFITTTTCSDHFPELVHPFLTAPPRNKDMGNCVAGEAPPETVRVMTDAGGIMELEGPVEVGTFLDDFPGYGVFKQGSGSAPLQKHERLCNGQLYYLFRLPKRGREVHPGENVVGKKAAASKMTAGPEVEVLPSPGKGVWKVRMVISREELAGILAEQGNTEALIERMRVAAAGAESSPRASGKGGRGGGGWRPSLPSACRPGQEE